MQAGDREEIRLTTGARTNLQASPTGSSATEFRGNLNEAYRDGEVMAEITVDTFFREFFEKAHINNTDMLDSEIYIAWTGMNPQLPRYYSRRNLPKNVGFDIRTTSDKDSAPFMIQNMMQFLQIMLSTKSVPPYGFDPNPTIEEIGRLMGLKPDKFRQKQNIADPLLNYLKRQQATGKFSEGDDLGGGNNFPDVPNSSIPNNPNPEPMSMSA